ncbi:FeS cluster assembly scaffold IscU [Tilletiopsis washingtonensis]|uniref:Iron-sulfur cluster assembly protein n=1 Tax=Tilletiopsis washingtonensis TaxID=58919 RepID=A0A316ZFT6_9BASI|nr:FeS cluster assembly scaffold IscU [Tilletiopsis washingtonensis]PWO00618.1 FeS cluster assembly scaffold IscU [Tilletiopsis washingtonensis]
MFRTAAASLARSAAPALAGSSRAAAARPALRAAAAPAFARTQKRAYHEKVIDHYENPRNVGSFPKGDLDVGIGLVGAPACGDVMKLCIKVSADGIIEDVRFKTFGCGSAIASSSYMTERVKGMTLEAAGAIKNTEIAKELSLPPVKLHCSMLAEDAIKAAIRDFKSKRDAAVAKGQAPKSGVRAARSSAATLAYTLAPTAHRRLAERHDGQGEHCALLWPDRR